MVTRLPVLFIAMYDVMTRAMRVTGHNHTVTGVYQDPFLPHSFCACSKSPSAEVHGLSDDLQVAIPIKQACSCQACHGNFSRASPRKAIQPTHRSNTGNLQHPSCMPPVLHLPEVKHACMSSLLEENLPHYLFSPVKVHAMQIV